MRIAGRPFKPTLAGTVGLLVLLPLLLSLGFWQLRRADEKRSIVDQFSSGGATTQLLTVANVGELSYLQHVMVAGAYDGERQVLLDNMPSSRAAAGFSQPGYRVLTPLFLNPKTAVLVDRGWIALGNSRAVLPNVAVEGNSRTVRGRLAELPRAGLRMQGAPAPATWPRVLNFPTMGELQKLYGVELLPRIVLLDPEEPDGFKRDWADRYSVAEFGPSKHVGYAVQWFGMALALVVIYVALALKGSASSELRHE